MCDTVQVPSTQEGAYVHLGDIKQVLHVEPVEAVKSDEPVTVDVDRREPVAA